MANGVVWCHFKMIFHHVIVVPRTSAFLNARYVLNMRGIVIILHYSVNLRYKPTHICHPAYGRLYPIGCFVRVSVQINYCGIMWRNDMQLIGTCIKYLTVFLKKQGFSLYIKSVPQSALILRVYHYLRPFIRIKVWLLVSPLMLVFFTLISFISMPTKPAWMKKDFTSSGL
jgi:hypothetical protein